MQEDTYLFNSKNSENLPHCREFIIAYCVKISSFYQIMPFQGNFCNSDKLSVLKQQLIYLQIMHGEGYPRKFIETKDMKPYSK